MEINAAASKDENMHMLSSHPESHSNFPDKRKRDSTVTPLPSTVIRFQKDDVQILEECFAEIGVSPRAAKRIVNVFNY